MLVSMKKSRKMFAVGLSMAGIAMLSGCATASRASVVPLAFAAPSYSSGDAYIRALDGGLISQANGLTLSEEDKKLALQAEYKALEDAPGGQAVPWSGGSGIKGTVVAATPYQVGSQNCRQYSQTVNDDGKAVVARGAACRNDNGTWSLLE